VALPATYRTHEINSEVIVNVLNAQGSEDTVVTSNAVTLPPPSKMVTGIFKDRDSAERAYGVIAARGYEQSDVNLVMSDATREKYFSDSSASDNVASNNRVAETELGNKAAEGAGVGGLIGGTMGLIAAAVAAVGTSIAIPGLGLFIAGPAAAALLGAGAGGLAGGVVGALVGWGIPEERIKLYQENIAEGGILLGVATRSDDDSEFIAQDWKNNRGEHVYR
jgi:hypothetical protein